MREKGLSRKAVLAQLNKIRDQDQQYDHGKILCSMCTNPHPIAEKAHRMFFSSNLGDLGLFSGTAQLEKEVVSQLSSLLHGKNAAGFIVSGGTEANMLALYAARNTAQAKEPEIVLPESAHFSFTKICNMLNLKPIYAKLNSAFQVEPSAVERCIGENTVAVVGSAGTAELGVIDPISKLSEIASDHNVHLHVDAAFGGLIIPFLNKDEYSFDFDLDGVKSITVDPHKMGMAAIPAGGILFKNGEALDFIKTQTPYLNSKFQYTFSGTRTGASVASAWAVFNYLGMEGFRKTGGECMKTTKLLADGIEGVGFKLVVKPTLNILAFKSGNTKVLAEKLWRKGWFVSYVSRYDCIRIVVMPHVKKQHALAFLKDLSE